jgi:hypothetical protein
MTPGLSLSSGLNQGSRSQTSLPTRPQNPQPAEPHEPPVKDPQPYKDPVSPPPSDPQDDRPLQDPQPPATDRPRLAQADLRRLEK